MKAAELRSRFIDYFVRHGHLHVPSASLVPEDDPTLLFTNAGMVQFKRVFLGARPPQAPRAVTAQKCLRVSGKHNDLEEVGRTARHHTFFEMLGNFSFGDYFKAEAIHYAWEFVTGELGLEPERIWATVHRDDDEAHGLWMEVSQLPPERVLRLGDKENFWQMGETGPCGPCSELHYDLRSGRASGTLSPEEFVAAGESDEFMEIWNLVFMQFDRGEDGVDRPLPAPSIDTGAGLERIAALLQDTRTSYHTDLFLPLIETAERLLDREYPREPERWADGLSFRVLADHARAVAFLLADGVFPANEGRGYVLRRILRRASRHAWLMGRREPTLDQLVEVVVDRMSDAYPELEARRGHLTGTTRAEEERFLATIDGGMERFEQIAPAGSSGTISGGEAFRLYDTYGFPLDLTELMAKERGYAVDVPGFERALEEQRSRSRRARSVRGSAHAGELEELVRRVAHESDSGRSQEFVGYERLATETAVLGYARRDGHGAFLLERNPFYAESGGQVSDVGTIRGDGWELRVERVVKDERGRTIVAGPVAGGTLPEAVEAVVAEVEESARRETERNHTATHLLHAALRAELGDHVQQAGSLVAPDRLRFDFSHHGPLTAEERRRVEERVNVAILANTPVRVGERRYREALAAGAMALFGEKYGDVVRVIEVPGVSLELCGGTHVRSTGQIGLFKIVHETGVAAGIRRVEAITGRRAYQWTLEIEDLLAGLEDRLHARGRDLLRRVELLADERSRLEAEAGGRRIEAARALVDRLLGKREPSWPPLVAERDVALPAGSDFAEFADVLRERLGSGAAILHVVVPEEGREAFVSVVTDDWVRQGVRAGDLVKAASGETGAGGGGRPHFAQGGVGDPGLVERGLAAAREHAARAMEGVSG
ncbi:MAG: alanine--tRNA ligase [Gemmatimonadota bacterium]